MNKYIKKFGVCTRTHAHACIYIHTRTFAHTHTTHTHTVLCDEGQAGDCLFQLVHRLYWFFPHFSLFPPLDPSLLLYSSQKDASYFALLSSLLVLCHAQLFFGLPSGLTLTSGKLWAALLLENVINCISHVLRLAGFTHTPVCSYLYVFPLADCWMHNSALSSSCHWIKHSRYLMVFTSARNLLQIIGSPLLL